MALNKKKTVTKKSLASKSARKSAPKSAPKTAEQPKNTPPTSKGPADSDKAGFVALLKKSGTAWTKARTEKAREVPQGEFELLPRGNYNAKIAAVALTTKEIKPQGARSTVRVPQARVQFTITEGDYKGRSVSQFHLLGNEVGWRILSEMLQRLEYDVEQMDTDDLVTALEQIGNDKPNVSIYVKIRKGDGKYEDSNQVYINKLLDGETKSDDDTDETQGENTESPDDENGNDEGGASVEIGMEVEHEDYGTCKVVDIDEDAETVTLKNAKGKRIPDVPLSELSVPEAA